MKKILSAVLSVIAAVSVCLAFAAPAMAEIHVYSPQAVAVIHEANDPLLNGKPTTQVTGAQVEAGSDQLVFTYTGDGELSGWNLIDKNGNAVDLDDVADKCKVVKMDGNTLIIEVLDWAAFESPDGYTVNCLAKVGSAPSGDADKDTSSTSPDTGVSVAAAAVSAVCAGAAILALSKKKDAE